MDMKNTEATKGTEMIETTSHDYLTDEHIHELCTETHSVGWKSNHCVECGLVICPEHLSTVGVFGSCDAGQDRR